MKMNEITTDLTRFGARERMMLEELLTAWNKYGLPEDFNDEEVLAHFNLNSGNVFLANSEYQLCMMNGEKLEIFYYCPQCGHEGFLEDMEHGENDEDCEEYLKSLKGE
jgi:hypothetical protein